MHKQTVEFVTVVRSEVVERIGRSSVYIPKTNFKGGSIKWYEEKPKKAVKWRRLTLGRSWANGQATIWHLATILWKRYATTEKIITIHLYEI